MAQDIVTISSAAPVLPKRFARDKDASRRFIEFFTANIRNPNTRRAYERSAAEFAFWCEREDLRGLASIEPVHVAAYIETLHANRLASPSVKQHLAAIRMLFGSAISAAKTITCRLFRATGLFSLSTSSVG
jgi:site-specific recombinase XerD